MKIFKPKKASNIVRLQFGSKSVSFEDATVERVFNLMCSVFKNKKVDRTIALKDHSVFSKPHIDRTMVTVRAEHGSYRKNGQKGASKSKSLYGITQEEALEYFLKNYEEFL